MFECFTRWITENLKKDPILFVGFLILALYFGVISLIIGREYYYPLSVILYSVAWIVLGYAWRAGFDRKCEILMFLIFGLLNVAALLAQSIWDWVVWATWAAVYGILYAIFLMYLVLKQI